MVVRYTDRQTQQRMQNIGSTFQAAKERKKWERRYAAMRKLAAELGATEQQLREIDNAS